MFRYTLILFLAFLIIGCSDYKLFKGAEKYEETGKLYEAKNNYSRLINKHPNSKYFEKSKNRFITLSLNEIKNSNYANDLNYIYVEYNKLKDEYGINDKLEKEIVVVNKFIKINNDLIDYVNKIERNINTLSINILLNMIKQIEKEKTDNPFYGEKINIKRILLPIEPSIINYLKTIIETDTATAKKTSHGLKEYCYMKKVIETIKAEEKKKIMMEKAKENKKKLIEYDKIAELIDTRKKAYSLHYCIEAAGYNKSYIMKFGHNNFDAIEIMNKNKEKYRAAIKKIYKSKCYGRKKDDYFTNKEPLFNLGEYKGNKYYLAHGVFPEFGDIYYSSTQDHVTIKFNERLYIELDINDAKKIAKNPEKYIIEVYYKLKGTHKYEEKDNSLGYEHRFNILPALLLGIKLSKIK